MFYDWLEINTSKAEEELIKKYKIDYLVYEFGGRKFFADTADLPRAYGHDLRYIGKSTVMDENFVHLGIHSGYELLNGSRSYEDYCNKAKFYGHKALGIAEKGTMAGCLEFQSVCKKNDIKPILGASYQIVSEIEEGLEYTAKFYVQNEAGWHSLLMLNKEANVDSLTRKVPESVVFANSEGLFCVLNTGAMSKETTEIFVSYKNAFKERVFFQFEAIEYVSDEVDRDYLLKLKNYIENYQKTIEPILINDSYYLEHEHASVKRNLNKIRDITTENRSDFYHYKTSFQTKEFLQNIFSDKEMFETLFNKAVSNAYDVADRCNFKIDTDGFKLPLYKPAPGVQYWDAQDHLKTMVRERFKEVIKRDNLTESEIIKYRVRVEDTTQPHT
jgi:DNA polymerase-3 subunit alpha